MHDCKIPCFVHFVHFGQHQMAGISSHTLYHSIDVTRTWTSTSDLMPKQAPVHVFLADPATRWWIDGGLSAVSVV